MIDFIAKGIISNYSGVLGMDIIKHKNFCFKFDEKVIGVT
jgi:hypothetical protein